MRKSEQPSTPSMKNGYKLPQNGELLKPASLGRCIDCNRMVFEGDDYSLNEANQIECAVCVDKQDWTHHGDTKTAVLDAATAQVWEFEDAYREGWWDGVKTDVNERDDEHCEAFWSMSQTHQVTRQTPRKIAPSQVEDLLEWLEIEISAIDIIYRGSPSYVRDSEWMKDEVFSVLATARESFVKPKGCAE